MASLGYVMKRVSFNSIARFQNGISRKWSEKCFLNLSAARHYAGAYAAEGKTHAVVLNRDFGAPLMIDSISPMGFKLNNGISCIGPIAIFPSSILSWDAGGLSDIDEDALTLFWLLEPKIDILLIGGGSNAELKSPEVRRIISLVRRHGINMEILPSEQACAAFNFLNAEGRFVGAALIPPKYVSQNEGSIDGRRAPRIVATPSHTKLTD